MKLTRKNVFEKSDRKDSSESNLIMPKKSNEGNSSSGFVYVGGMRTRWWHIVLWTSAVWFLLDCFLLFYMMDCMRSPAPVQEKNSPPSPNEIEKMHGHQPEEAIEKHKEEKNVDENIDVDKVFRIATEHPPDTLLEKLLHGLRFDSGGPGEMGRPVHIEPEMEAEMKERFKENQFNIMASDRISLNRSLPDPRQPA